MIQHISTHTPLAGRDWIGGIEASILPPFLLTRPLRDVTLPETVKTDIVVISTHTPLAGRDETEIREHPETGTISTHTPLAGRDRCVWRTCQLYVISTHTPLAGRDLCRVRNYILDTISTHTPLAGRDYNPDKILCI